MKKYTVHLSAQAGVSVEIEAPEDWSAEKIFEEAYNKADLSDVKVSGWNYDFAEMEEENGNFIKCD